eukprot:93571-Alexandrium_andersonii.AAC.1
MLSSRPRAPAQLPDPAIGVRDWGRMHSTVPSSNPGDSEWMPKSDFRHLTPTQWLDSSCVATARQRC